MKQNLLLLFPVFFLFGCTTVDWDAGLKEKQYKFVFKNKEREYVSGVKAFCYGNKVHPSSEIAKEINESSNISSSNGEIHFKHSRFSYGGRYFELGPFKLGDYKIPTVYCEFKHNQKIVESGNLIKYLKPVVEIVI